MNVDAALAASRAQGLDRFEAQALLAAALGVSRAWLIAHGDAMLDAPQAARHADWLVRLKAGEPLAYLRGRQEFHGLDLAVNRAVLVPRPDTETLVDWALELLAPISAAEVLDLGTGSGAVALAIAHAASHARLTAVDASAEALEVARGNGASLGLPVEWRLGSWFDALEDDRRFELVVSNPPYVAEGDPHLAALREEPAMALVAGAEGLDALRLIAAQAPRHLAPGGWLLLEHGHEQAEAVTALLRKAGFAGVESRRDLAGRPRCTGGRRR